MLLVLLYDHVFVLVVYTRYIYVVLAQNLNLLININTCELVPCNNLPM